MVVKFGRYKTRKHREAGISIAGRSKYHGHGVIKQFCLKSNKKTSCIIKHQSQFRGDVIRRGGLENILTAGKINDRRDRDRQLEKMLDSVIVRRGMRPTEVIFRCKAGRRLWRDMIANV
jgi:hypothetical protein